MIRKLPNKDERVAEEIVQLQRSAYAVEASLIGVQTLPPMTEILSEIRTSHDLFYGFMRENTPVGIISFENGILGERIITRLAVDPAFFHRGIASQLLTMLVENSRGAGISVLCVSTACGNTPALHLYQKCGFAPVKRDVTREGIQLQRFRLELSESIAG